MSWTSDTPRFAGVSTQRAVFRKVEVELQLEADNAIAHLQELVAIVECGNAPVTQANLSFKRTPGGSA